MMSWLAVEAGLLVRRFRNVHKACNKGECSTNDDENYVLLTDGLIIWSDMRNWEDEDATYRVWHLDEFSFEELDRLINKTSET